MKRTKRCLALALVFAMLMSITGMLSVSAERSYVGPTLKVNGEYVTGDVVIASVDFKVDSAVTGGMALRFIKKDGGTPYGAVRLNPYGWLMTPGGAVGWDGDWMDSYQTANNWSHGSYADDTVHNIKVRLEKGTGTSGTIDYYLDNEWIYQATGDLSGFDGWDYVSGVAPSTEEMSYLSIKVNSVLAVKSGELSPEVDVKADLKNKELKVCFSETPNAAINNAVLKKVNVAEGEENIALTPKSIACGTATFGCELEAGEEYALILPENVAGAHTGHKPVNRYLYFTTDNYSVVAEKLYDLETDEKSFLVDISSGNYAMTKDDDGNDVVQRYYVGGTVVDTDDTTHGKAIQLTNTISHDGGTSYGLYGEYNWNGPVGPANGDITAYSFDVKALKPNLQVGIRIKAQGGGTPLSIAFGKSGYVIGGFSWVAMNLTNADNYTTNGNITPLYIGDYNTTDWINFRMEYDKINKIARIYMNGELVRTETNITSFDGVKWTSFVVHSTNMINSGIAEDEPLLLLDNVQTEVVTRPLTVSKISFNAANDTKTGAFAEAGSAPETITVGFTKDVALANEQSTNVKLFYDNQEIGYTAAYDAAAKTYTITPASLAAGGQKVKVQVSGITVGNETVKNYSAYQTIQRDIKINLAVTDADGNDIESFYPYMDMYAKLDIANDSGASLPFRLIVAQYKADGTLISADAAYTYTVDDEGALNIDCMSENPVYFAADENAAKVKVFLWDGLTDIEPYCREAEVNIVE